MKILFSALLISIIAFASHAKTWGPATAVKPGFDRAAALDSIFSDLSKADDWVQSKLLMDRVWLTFMMAPDEESAEDLNRALRERGGYSFNKALDILDGLIARHPNYAEGWNQRSYVHFLKEDYDKSLADCRHALTLEPRHIGCLSGMARILIRHKKNYVEGRALLEKAIELNPFVYEKVLLKEIPEEEL